MLPPARDPVSPAALAAAACARADLADVLEEIHAWLGRRYGAPSSFLAGSGTQALTLALRIAFRETGSRRVSLPAYGCYALASAAVGAGAEALFHDLDPATLSPDPDSLRDTLEAGARTVVVAHFYGNAADMGTALRLAHDYGACLVEDAAQGTGGALDGMPLGGHGTLSVLSFGRGKGLTSGGGGALLVRDEALRELAGEEVRRVLSTDGGRRRRGWKELAVSAAQWASGHPSLYRIPASLPFLGLGETVYRPPEPVEPIAARAAHLLLREIERGGLEEEARSRRRRAGRMAELLEDVAGVDVVRPVPGSVSGALRLPLLAPGSRGCPSLGVVGAYPRCLPQLGVLDRPPGAPAIATPGARDLRDSLMTAPTHEGVEERDLREVVRWARSAPGRPVLSQERAGGISGSSVRRTPIRRTRRRT